MAIPKNLGRSAIFLRLRQRVSTKCKKREWADQHYELGTFCRAGRLSEPGSDPVQSCRPRFRKANCRFQSMAFQ